MPLAPDFGPRLVESYAVNERMNQVVLAHLDPAAWQARLLDKRDRTIAAIFSHMHNARRKWLRLSAPHIGLPAALKPTCPTPQEAAAALAESGARCTEMLAGVGRPVRAFRRDGWAHPWPAGASMAAYMIAHDAHHRGQACMLARQLGYPLPVRYGAGMWVWESLYKECGFARPR